jgi:nitroimidazol reductase NimA-like FMN-containing flavoprotein (pyridoxamine 5'-phosphate oxidase superfamily)
MLIREMTRDECVRVLSETRLARLATARENQPYIVPVYVMYDEATECLYGFTTPGQKVEWMRANPLVCVEMDKVTAYDQWVSLVIFGHFEEVLKTPGNDGVDFQAQLRPPQVGEAIPPCAADQQPRVIANEQEHAWQLLKSHPVWSEPGCTAWAARAHRDSAEPFRSVYYRIRINQVTGHEATRDAKDAIYFDKPSHAGDRFGWLRKTVTNVFGGGTKEELAKGPADAKIDAVVSPEIAVALTPAK